MTTRRPPASGGSGGLHWAWVVAAVTFVTLVGVGRLPLACPGVLMDPLHMEFGWSHGTIGLAVSVNMVLFGLISPFAAALMDRFGIRPVVTFALLLVAAREWADGVHDGRLAAGACWGVLVGVGAGSMSMAFVATVVNRWFVARRGLVSGILTAGNATGQLIFLPLVAWITPTTAGVPLRSRPPRPRSPSYRWSSSCCATTPPTWDSRRTAPPPRTRARPRTRVGSSAGRALPCSATPPASRRSGCSPAASRSAAPPPTA